MAALRRRLREVEERLAQRDAQRAQQAADLQRLTEAGEVARREAQERRERLTPEQREQDRIEQLERREQERIREIREEQERLQEEEERLWEQVRGRSAMRVRPFRGLAIRTPEMMERLEERLRQWHRAQGTVDSFHVHHEAAKLNKKIPMIIKVIKKHIPSNDYSDFVNFLDEKVKTYLETSPDFKQKTVNSEHYAEGNASGKRKYKARVLKREDWLQDYNAVKKQLVSSVDHILDEQKERLGSIIDFVFKNDLQECFTMGFIYDNAHAYNGNSDHRLNPESCFGGILERAVSTFVNCIKGMTGGPFTELSAILEDTPLSWDELDKSTKAEWIREWNDFLTKWAIENLENPTIKSMPPKLRSQGFLEVFTHTKSPPPYVIEHFKKEFLKGLDGLWEDYGYNAEGGSRVRKTRRAKAAKKHSRRKQGSRIR